MIPITNNHKRIITNEDLHDMIVASFDRFFDVVDKTNKELKSELKAEFKKEISELRSDMNSRFLIVDKRLLSIENNMLYRNEFDPLVKRVEWLEAQ